MSVVRIKFSKLWDSRQLGRLMNHNDKRVIQRDILTFTNNQTSM